MRYRNWLLNFVVIGVLLGIGVFIIAQSDNDGTILANINVRTGPGAGYAVVTVIASGTEVTIEGRNSVGNWLLIHTPDNSIRGWVASRYVDWDDSLELAAIPVTSETLNAGSSGSGTIPGTESTVSPAYFASEPFYSNPLEALRLPANVLQNARAIYYRGLQLGNHSDSFMKIGDSSTAGTVFLCPFEWGTYNLGEYAALQGIVDLFNQTDAFCRDNLTARNGYSSGHFLDSTWADPNLCNADESPLACEYRRTQPSFAVIYIGMGDMASVTLAGYRGNLVQMVEFLSQHGVVPILTTYPMADAFADGKPPAFNEVIRDVAADYQLPLIDLRAALYYYENRGCGPDGYHLSVRDINETTFTGDEFVYGRTLRELLTLQMLHDLVVNF